MAQNGQNGASGQNGGPVASMAMNPYTSQSMVMAQPRERDPNAAYATAMAGPGPDMRLDQEDLAVWIRARISPLQGKYRCTHFYLQHDVEIDGGHDRETILQRSLPEPDPSPKKKGEKAEPPRLSEEEEDEWIVNLCEEMDRASWMHTATYPRMQRFFVGAVILPPDLDPSEERKVHAQEEYPFLVTPPPAIAAGFQQSGDPNGDIHIPRLFEQAQETAERAVKMLVANMQANADRAERREQMLIDMNERLLERAFAEARVKEELLDARALRDIQVKREEMNIELHQKLWLKLAEFGITTGTKVMKAWMRPKGDQIDSKIMQSMMTLDPKNLVEVIGVINRMPASQREKFGPVIEMVVESFDDAKQMEVFQLLTETAAADEFKAEQAKKGVEFRPGASSDNPTGGGPTGKAGSK